MVTWHWEQINKLHFHPAWQTHKTTILPRRGRGPTYGHMAFQVYRTQKSVKTSSLLLSCELHLQLCRKAHTIVSLSWLKLRTGLTQNVSILAEQTQSRFDFFFKAQVQCYTGVIFAKFTWTFWSSLSVRRHFVLYITEKTNVLECIENHTVRDSFTEALTGCRDFVRS